MATRVKILRDFFRVRATCGLASCGGDSLLMEESGRGQKELYFFPGELVIRSVGSAADKVYAPFVRMHIGSIGFESKLQLLLSSCR